MIKQQLTKEEKKQARALRDLKKGKRSQWQEKDE
jgi:hypothetical protein